jgi:hypothetical protein
VAKCNTLRKIATKVIVKGIDSWQERSYNEVHQHFEGVKTTMPILKETAFLFPKDVVSYYLPDLSGTEAKVLLAVFDKQRWLLPPQPISSRVLAREQKMSRVTVMAALDKLEEIGLIKTLAETADGKIYTFNIDDEGVAQNLSQGWLKNQATPTPTTSGIRARGSNMDEVESDLSSNDSDKVIQPKLSSVDIRTDSKNLEEDNPISDETDSASTKPSPPNWSNPLLTRLELPLRVRVLMALSGAIPIELLPLEDEAEATTSEQRVVKPLNSWQVQILVLRALWKLLYGEQDMPDAKAMGSLVSKFGGKNGGSARLAMAMMRYTSMDTNPMGLLYDAAKRTRAEIQTNAIRYRDYGDVEKMPEREDDLDV